MMSIALPFFNYTPQLYKEVVQADILFSEYSILRLLCLKELPVSVAQQLALDNYNCWLAKFIINSNLTFYSGAEADVGLYKTDYTDLLLSCLLTATLYEYSAYNVNILNADSYVRWKEGLLIVNRPMSQLL